MRVACRRVLMFRPCAAMSASPFTMAMLRYNTALLPRIGYAQVMHLARECMAPAAQRRRLDRLALPISKLKPLAFDTWPAQLTGTRDPAKARCPEAFPIDTSLIEAVEYGGGGGPERWLP